MAAVEAIAQQTRLYPGHFLRRCSLETGRQRRGFDEEQERETNLDAVIFFKDVYSAAL